MFLQMLPPKEGGRGGTKIYEINFTVKSTSKKLNPLVNNLLRGHEVQFKGNVSNNVLW